METLLPAYKTVGERRYRETSGLYWEDFEPGDVFEHRPGRTVLDVDNTYFTLLTLNIQRSPRADQLKGSSPSRRAASTRTGWR